MLSFGMPTLLETSGPADCAALCSSLGMQFIELNMNLPQYQPGSIDEHLLRRIMRESNLYFTLHLDENLNVSDFNPYASDAWRRTALQAAQLALQLDMPAINMHLPRGVYFTLPTGRVYLFDQYRDRYLSSVQRFRDECTALLQGSPVRILIENCDGFLPFQTEAVLLMLESPAFGLTLDTGHSHAAGHADEPLIRAHAHRLHHMHLHDALGKVNHLPLGAGEADIAGYLSLAKACSARVVLETKTIRGLQQSVAWLRTHISPGTF